jgi:SnoaL-like domain
MTRKILILFAMLLGSCDQQKPLNSVEKDEIIKEVRQTLNNYYDDIRKSGLSAEFNYLDNSSDFFWVPPKYPECLSYDSVVSILKQSAPKYKYIDNKVDFMRINPLNKELAVYTCQLHSVMTDTSGNVLTYSMIETGVLIKRKDGWKLLSGQTSILDK